MDDAFLNNVSIVLMSVSLLFYFLVLFMKFPHGKPEGLNVYELETVNLKEKLIVTLSTSILFVGSVLLYWATK